MDIVPLEAARIPEFHAVFCAAHAGSPLPPVGLRRFTVWATTGWSGSDVRVVVAVRDGAIIGGAGLIRPLADNTHLARLSNLAVHPGHRRQGVGTALARHLLDGCDRKTVIASSSVTGPAVPFARALGMTEAMPEAIRCLDLGRLADDHLDRLRSEAVRHSHGYTLEQWSGPTPEHLLPDLVTLAESMNDAPVGDTGMEDMVWDVDRVRQYEEAYARSGERAYVTLARHAATGQVAGFTRIFAEDDRDDGYADQEDTTVLREHRGHRLGLLVKLANLELLRAERPEITKILTGNADSNRPMLAINEMMGFEIVDRWVEWRLQR
ncbi:GNAT family N-acetyltransferase [Nonomuraea soli]|uniref:GNAT superfamily N-acetyltransferase n=1 Tax=Nonomuraea soli TaxID=1032476 RepID=A0A7W0HT21_9ACTN|nr:GNAT family N-acetyltransferase [Nonomuraea soli]MBA2894668.1 GNAT superfamily N-acetyltransferase [Nonomuraea soli]